MKKLAPLLLALAIVGVYQLTTGPTSDPGGDALTSTTTALTRAFDEHASGVEVEGEGTVVKVLADDRSGSRHQRFILQLDSGQTVLVAHNIDLAPRLAGLEPGDSVGFRGEYEWNDQGGVVHWTHHDPQGQHPSGWLKHEGQVVQ